MNFSLHVLIFKDDVPNFSSTEITNVLKWLPPQVQNVSSVICSSRSHENLYWHWPFLSEMIELDRIFSVIASAKNNKEDFLARALLFCQAKRQIVNSFFKALFIYLEVVFMSYFAFISRLTSWCGFWAWALLAVRGVGLTTQN